MVAIDVARLFNILEAPRQRNVVARDANARRNEQREHLREREAQLAKATLQRQRKGGPLVLKREVFHDDVASLTAEVERARTLYERLCSESARAEAQWQQAENLAARCREHARRAGINLAQLGERERGHTSSIGEVR